MAASSTDSDIEIGVEDLPLTFKVKYVGCEVARGIWGIKYTRRPVDIMVGAAKKLPPNKTLPQCDLKVSTDGVSTEIIQPNGSINNYSYPIDTISYGVQDLIYTRVFAMIVVKDDNSVHPFEVHAFVCDSRAMARKLTYALAAAFQEYSRRVNEHGDLYENSGQITPTRQKFAIDLRSPEELAEDDETEA